MIRLSRFTLLFLVFIFVAPLALASQTAVKLASGIDLIKEWQADQHLYISGDINLSSQELANLEDWLDQNGKNWTVLLSQSSAKERHRDPFGAQRRGVEALEIALTVDLPAKTGFGKIIDQKTGHPNGALFIIHLKERQLSYYGSDYYQHNGAPTHRFQNDLDAPARKALRDGGRIVDAVKRTVTAVDSRARTTINSRAQRRLESAQAAKQEIIDLRQKLKSVTAKHAAISAKLTKSGGDLSHFPAAKFENQLSNMEKKPTIFNSSLIRDELTKWDKHLKVYHTDAERFTKLTEQLEGAQPTSEKGKANQKASLAQLAKARENYQLGNFSYQEQLRHGENLFSSIEPADALALQKEQRRRDTLKIGGATTAGGLCLIGFLGNRRRRRIKAEAEALLAARKLEIKETEDRLFELMDRAAIIVGPFNELKSRGYQGETLTLSKKALKEIDRAFVLSSNVQKIIEEGEELISPSNPLSRSTNIVTGGRYEKAVDLLDAELNLGLQNVPELKERSRPGEEVDGTFSVPIDEWGARTTQALDSASECLDRVEDAWSTIVARRETLNTNIEALVSRQNEIQVDEWLRCELLFDEWIPAMTEAETKAAETGKSDPVQALEGDMAEGDRMAQEAKTQLDLLTKFRSQHWQDLEKNEATLDDRKRATIWVDERLAQLSKSADDIASTSPDGTVADSISSFGDDLQAFSQRVSHSASLIVRADDEALPSIKNTTQVVTIARW